METSSIHLVITMKSEMKPYIFWMTICLSSYLYQALNVSAKKSLVWGPGLDARITLPARYFFVQAVDKGNKK